MPCSENKLEINEEFIKDSSVRQFMDMKQEVNAILGLVLPAWPETNSQMKPCENFKLENWSTSTIERMVSVGREKRIPIGSAVEA